MLNTAEAEMKINEDISSVNTLFFDLLLPQCGVLIVISVPGGFLWISIDVLQDSLQGHAVRLEVAKHPHHPGQGVGDLHGIRNGKASLARCQIFPVQNGKKGSKENDNISQSFYLKKTQIIHTSGGGKFK